MTEPLTFQQVILRLQEFWANHGCLIWQPYSEKVGAGTMNPATVLRVLGPEPWNVGYVEPSYRPDDGRYGDNPNRMQMHTQFQVILKPDPGNPQELFLESLEALGISREEHDIRFVEDNWEAPALGAWGLGWEVWLDGLEITQFTYFQQSGGIPLDPPSVEITYGLERIIMFLQRVRSVWEIDWDGLHTYGEVLLEPEVEHCRYDFEVADIEALQQMYSLYDAEAQRCLEANLVIPAHDYVLRCSHTFNLLDSRGAVGVTERATYFRRMRELSRQVAQGYLEQRQRLEYPWLREEAVATSEVKLADSLTTLKLEALDADTFLLEIGTEELPAEDLSSALVQLRERMGELLERERLEYAQLRVLGTPRRSVVLVEGLAPRQKPVEELVKGPPARAAFDGSGRPTKAAQGFARKHGVSPRELEIREVDGGEYVVAVQRQEGESAVAVLSEYLPELIASMRFGRSMRWNESGIAFSRPIRWFVALFGDLVIPFSYAGVTSGRTTRGSRPEGSPQFDIPHSKEYLALMKAHDIVVDHEERMGIISEQVARLAAGAGGQVIDDAALLEEVTHLVEQPTALLGQFEEAFLQLPAEVLIAVMKKHQRYFPVVDKKGKLLPYFIAVRNGGEEHMDVVQLGNEEVIRARFADADYFFKEDTRKPLEDFLPRLDTLTFQERLGSMLAKVERMEQMVAELAGKLEITEDELGTAKRAAHLSKADLATDMVVEFTSLQGVMGSEYGLRSGEPPEVAQAIREHYLPRFTGDAVAQTKAGLVIGLADRLDSLVGLFAVDLAPTGSADPYGLRRDALGLIQSLIDARLEFSVREGLSIAAKLLPVKPDAEKLASAAEFVNSRLRVYLRDQGFRYDVVDAVLAARGDDPFRALVAVEQLSKWVEREDWTRILDNYARCVRITRDLDEQFGLDPSRLDQPAEEELHAAYQEAQAKVSRESSVDEFLEAFVPMVDVIDTYFAKESGVMVMAEEQELRENRLAQLQLIAGLADGIVDLSKLEGF